MLEKRDSGKQSFLSFKPPKLVPVCARGHATPKGKKRPDCRQTVKCLYSNFISFHLISVNKSSLFRAGEHRHVEQTDLPIFCLLFPPDFCEDNEAGLHAHPDNCYGFIMCDMAGNTYEMDCPAGLKFNPANLVCDWPHNVECEDGSTGSGEQSGF